MLSVNTNIISLGAQNNLNRTQSALGQSLQRLSSGLRINSAADDSAGYSIVNRFTSQINGLNQAVRNANDGVSLAQTADGALGSIQDNLQRIRELAVESANGSNSGTDRSSLQAEASQLLQEIDRVAKSTQFNGVNLLDGSFNAQFQVGANVGQTVGIKIGSVQSKDLGGGNASVVTARGSTNKDALAYGDLVINGTAVAASAANTDTLSSQDNADSSIAKVAAINAVSAQTGVTATVDANVMAGGSMNATTIGATGSLTINGVAIGTVAEGSTVSATRQSIVQAINANSAQTGVVATDSGNDQTGITLSAADGRNITVSTGGSLSVGNMGLASGTHYGGFSLQSNNAINITSTTGNAALDAGLSTGTYNSATAYVTGTNVSAAAFGSGDFSINGVLVGATTDAMDTGSSINKSYSAIAKAAAINAITSQTGVTATANANTVAGVTTGAGVTSGHTFSLTINGIAIASTFTESSSTANDQQSLIGLINADAGQTGVTAAIDNTTGGIALKAADGRNIDVASTAGNGSLADVGLAAATTTYGTVTLSSSASFKIADVVNGGSAKAGLALGTYGAGKNGQALNTIDLSTTDGANKALTAIDNAINQVNSQAGALGAYQNRFTATVSNLQSTAQNLTAARSQVQDTDFASETANLSRSQVLQQAGTAMLAQANQMGQSVLSLLK